MNRYNLQSDEAVILQTHDARLSTGRAYSNVELMLTNKNLVYTSEKPRMFGSNEVYQQVYPLRDVKIVGGQAQVRLWNSSNVEHPCLKVFLRNGDLTFKFTLTSKRAAQKQVIEWVNAISVALTGHPSNEKVDPGYFSIPGVSFLAETLKGTVDSVVNTWNNGDTKSAPRIQGGDGGMVTKNCIGCRAPLTGAAGQSVRCGYCDTNQTL